MKISLGSKSHRNAQYDILHAMNNTPSLESIRTEAPLLPLRVHTVLQRLRVRVLERRLLPILLPFVL